MSINKSIYQDNTGKQFKQDDDGQWQTLKPGVGWVEFEGYAVMTNGFIADCRKDEPEKEEKQVCGTIENDLFQHYASVMLRKIDHVGYAKCQHLAQDCCDMAQAMIDELKERGRL